MRTKLDSFTQRKLSVEVPCDMATLRKVARGEPVRGIVGVRARAVLVAAGFKLPPAREWVDPRTVARGPSFPIVTK